MDIFVWDLGPRRQSTLLRMRGLSVAQNVGRMRPLTHEGAPTLISWGDEPDRRPVGLLGRLWSRGTGCQPDMIRDAMHNMRGPIGGMLGGMLGGSTGFFAPALALAAQGQSEIAAALAACGVLMGSCAFWIPGVWLRRVCRTPVGVAELEALAAVETSELERAYLRLAAEAARQTLPQETAERVRSAIQALGEAIDGLPVMAMPRVGVEALHAEAAQARTEAAGEADPVVAASHGRRADALARSAESAERAQALMRRAAALRDEMLAQVESLRLGLSGFQSAVGDVGGLASLADAVRDVVEESRSVAEANAELDAAMPASAPAFSAPESPEIALQQLHSGDG